VVYFTVSSIVLNWKLTSLYSLILKNEKLVDEMKKLLTIFPYGVIIQKCADTGHKEVVFSNREFETKICEVKRSIEEMKTVTVKYPNKNDTTQAVITDLYKCLDKHQHKLERRQVVEQNKVTIDC